MGLYVLKFPYRKVLLPLAKSMKWVDPDILSYLALVIALLTGWSIFLAPSNNTLLILVIFLTFLRMTLNTLDGVIAIERGKTSLSGEIVNALPDRYADIFVMLGIAFSSYCNIYIGCVAAISVLLVSYSGMLGKAIGVNWQHHGPLGKVERLILIIAACFLQFLFVLNGHKSFMIFSYQITIFELLMFYFIFAGQVTVFNRLRGMQKEIMEGENVK